MDKVNNKILQGSDGRELLEELNKFKESKKESIFELLKDDAQAAVLERHVFLGIESTIDFIELLIKVHKK